MIQKATVGMMIGLATMMIAVKTVTVEGYLVKAVDVDRSSIYRKIISIRQGIIILQITVVGSKTGYLEIDVSLFQLY